jgi:hypothetical protein
MSWPSALPKLSCKIKGSDGIGDSGSLTQAIGTLVWQQEQ